MAVRTTNYQLVRGLSHFPTHAGYSGYICKQIQIQTRIQSATDTVHMCRTKNKHSDSFVDITVAYCISIFFPGKTIKESVKISHYPFLSNVPIFRYLSPHPKSSISSPFHLPSWIPFPIFAQYQNLLAKISHFPFLSFQPHIPFLALPSFSAITLGWPLPEEYLHLRVMN